MRTRGVLLGFAIAFALRGARKLVRGLREELTEEERYRVANDGRAPIETTRRPVATIGRTAAQKRTLHAVSGCAF